jgi:serine/threonine kinase 38
VVAFALSNPDSLTLTLSRIDNGYGVLQIVNWRTYLKFPAEARLSPEAKNLICRLLCDVEHRMRGADEIKAHPWFKGVPWDTLYEMDAAFKPEVNGELDTQNFEKFEEAGSQPQHSSRSGPWRKMLTSKDVNFVGYTYKNFDMVKGMHAPVAELKKKTQPKRPSIVSLFGMVSYSSLYYEDLVRTSFCWGWELS